MRIFSIVLTLVLVGAVVLPMYMKDPAGKPIMSAEDWVPETPKPLRAETPMYKWRDADGVWQFGETPPEDVSAELVQLDSSRVTPMGNEWNVKPVVEEPESANPSMRDIDRLMELMPK